MKKLFVLLLLPVAVAFALDGADVKTWTIPEGEVVQVKIGDTVVWPTIPYVTDGLVALYDGIWNSGIGLHSSTATKWVDLSGHGFDGTQQRGIATGEWEWIEDAYVGKSNTFHGFNLPRGLTPIVNANFNNLTLEAVAVSGETPTWGTVFGNFKGSGYGGGYCWDIDNRYTGNGMDGIHGGMNGYFNSDPYFSPTEGRHDMRDKRWTYTSLSTPSETAMYYNGIYIQSGAKAMSNAGTNEPWGLARTMAGSLSSKNFVGQLCCLRFYTRVLTEEEIAHNAIVDWRRFGIIPYVTDGLVAMYDGEWNAGIGVHDPNATTWKDLVGGLDFTWNENSPVSWNSNHLFILNGNKTGDNICSTNLAVPNETTVEVVAGYDWKYSDNYSNLQTPVRWVGTAVPCGARRYDGNNYPGLSVFDISGGRLHSYAGSTNVVSAGKIWSMSVAGPAPQTITFYVNGAPETRTVGYTEASSLENGLLQLRRGARADMRIYCVRLYNRHLTEDEILYNVSIDGVRFKLGETQ